MGQQSPNPPTATADKKEEEEAEEEGCAVKKRQEGDYPLISLTLQGAFFVIYR